MISNKSDLKIIKHFNYAANALIFIGIFGIFGLLNTSDLELLTNKLILTEGEYVMFTILYVISGLAGVWMKCQISSYLKSN